MKTTCCICGHEMIDDHEGKYIPLCSEACEDAFENPLPPNFPGGRDEFDDRDHEQPWDGDARSAELMATRDEDGGGI